MFKRIGATILTIVMLLSMASVVSLAAESEKMGLKVTYVDSNGNQIEYAAPGESFTAVVEVENPVAVSGMAVAGIYDSALFTAGEPVVESPIIGETELKGIAADSVEGKILVSWIADSNVLLADDTVLMTVPLTLKEEADPGKVEISFFFVEDEMYVKGDGKPVKMDAALFSADSVKAPITVGTPPEDTALEVVVDPDATVGEKITVKVNVKNYAQNWTTMAIIGSYNDEVLELIESESEMGSFNADNGEAVKDLGNDAENGNIVAAWVNKDIVKNSNEFNALTLTFKVKALGDANLSFSFKEDDIYGVDSENPLTTGFSTEAVEPELNITEKRDPTELVVDVDPEATVGEKITVKVDVKNYAQNWTTMAIIGSYNDDVLELIESESEMGSFNADNGEATKSLDNDAENGNIVAVWVNEDIVKNSNEFNALTLTFKVKAIGDAKLSFYFKEDDIYGKDSENPLTDGFSTEAVEPELNITEKRDPTALEVVVDPEATVGEKITVKVDVKNYAQNWTTMAIIGSYNDDVLELIENESEMGSFNADNGEAVKRLDNDAENGNIVAAWVNEDIVKNSNEFNALTLTFKVNAVGDAKLSFYFKEDDIYGEDSENPLTDGFSTEAVKPELKINPASSKAHLVVDVVNEEDSVIVGKTVTVKVRVEGYESNWAVMSIMGQYDSKRFELLEQESTIEKFSDGGITDEPIVSNKKGALGVTWLNDNTVTKEAGFDVMTLVFEVLAESDHENAKESFDFFFVPDGILGADGEVAENTFETGKASATVTVVPNNVKTTLSVDVKEGTVKVGKKVHVEVYVQDYISLWSTMTIQGTYDSTKLYVDQVIPEKFCGEREEAEGVEPVIKYGDGNIYVCWPNTDRVEKDESFKALEIVFVAVDEGEAKVEFGFMKDCILDAAGQKAPEEWYDTGIKDDSVILEDSQTLLSATASSDRAKVGDQVTYTVNVQKFHENWLAMALEVKYDHQMLKFSKAKSLIDNFYSFDADPTEDGIVNAAWINSDPVDDLGENFDVMEITFEVIGEGNTDVFIGFKPDGIIAQDPLTGDITYAPKDSFVADPVKMPITLFAAPYLEIVGADNVIENEEYTVNLVLKDYKNAWSSFGAELVYDTNAFIIEDVATKIVAESFGGVDPDVDTTVAGTIRLDWSKAENISAERNVTVLSVTFKALSAQEDVVFNANLVDVKTNVNDNVDAYDYEAAAKTFVVDIVKRKKPYLTMVVDPGNSMIEGDSGVLKLYLNEYTSEWNSIPVVLTYDPKFIHISEKEITCNSLGDFEGEVVQRSNEGKLVFTWFARQNIEADGDSIELASIPFEAYKDGDAVFGAKFVDDNLLTYNQDGKHEVVNPSSYVLEAKKQTVSISNKYADVEPMFLTVESADETIKGKKETLNLKLNNYNPRVQALSVKLFYDKDKVTLSKEDIQDMLGDDQNIVGAIVLNKAEGYVHFTWVSSDANMANETNPILAKLQYTPNVLGSVSFHAEFEQVIDNELNLMEPVFDYIKRGETKVVDVNATPNLSATVDETDVEIGDKITVTISINEYQNLWSDMTINGSYNKNMLKLDSITLTDAFGEKSYETGDGTFTASWSNDKNIAADSSVDVITLVFEVIDCGVDGDAGFSFTFGEVLSNGNSLLTPDQDYIVNSGDVSVNVKVCDHVWSKTGVHSKGTSGTASKHTLTCTKNCGASKEFACAITTTKTKATCTKAGTITYKCAVCGYDETLIDPNVPALDHMFDGKPVHKDGTNEHVFTCTRGCGTTKKEKCVYKLQVVDPTCLKDGYTIYTCTICGDRHNEDVVKAKGEHGALTLHYIAPTAKNNGGIVTQCDTCKEYVAPPYAGAVKKTLKAGHPFPDVQEPTSWYYDQVNFNKAFEIFGGDEKGNFNPTANITRGQLVTVLGRIMMAEAEKTMTADEFNKFLNAQTSKVSGMKSTSGFTDLGGKYYERYAKLFAKWGIVNGYPDGTFGGDKNITREEMATLIKRFVEAYPDADANIKFGNAATFSDFAKVSGWAKGNVEWVGKVGLFQGDTNKNYNPKSNATRAEIAVVIYRMLPVLKNICVCSLNH